MKHSHEIPAIAGLLLCILFALSVSRAQQQTAPQQEPTLSKENQARVADMLRDAYNEVKKNYYDPKLHGLDWDARYRQYSAMIGQAHNLGEGFRVVAAFLGGLDDSHTYFVPPARAAEIDPGYRFALIGNAAFITRVRPKTDAESKLHVGDQMVRLDGFDVNRADFHDVQYFFNTLAPQAAEQLDLQAPTDEQRRVVVQALIRPTKRVLDLTGEGGDVDYYELLRRSENEDDADRSWAVEDGDLAIWKLQHFFPESSDALNSSDIEKAIDLAQKHKTLILDLRGNGGGAIETLEQIVGALFDHDVKICDQVGKKGSKPMIAKRQRKQFDGKLIVLVDAGSASCSELLARVVQLEHRGTVIGDRTAGAVMEARYHSESQGVDTEFFYGINVTSADLIMSDGRSLEKTGVVPDELLLPTGADLAAGRDPVLAHAAELAGVKLDPAAAGKLFPFKWQPL
jgi:carboxyl-terminal processing protease